MHTLPTSRSSKHWWHSDTEKCVCSKIVSNSVWWHHSSCLWPLFSMILSLLDIDQRVGLYRLISHKLYKTTLVPSNKSDKKKKKTNRKVFYRLHIVLIFQGFALSYFIIPTQNKNKTRTHTQKTTKTKQNRTTPPPKKNPTKIKHTKYE